MSQPILQRAAEEDDEADDGLLALWRFLSRSGLALRRRWHIALLVALIGSGAIFAHLALRPPRYVSRGLVQIGLLADADASEDLRFAAMADKAFNTHLRLLTSERVTLAAMERTDHVVLPPGPDRDAALEEFLGRVTISPLRDTFLVELSSWSDRPGTSAARVNNLLDVFVSTSNEFVGSRFVAEEAQAREREAQAGRALELARSRQSDFLIEHGRIPFDAKERAVTVRSRQLEERFALVEIKLATIAAEVSRAATNLEPGRRDVPEVMLGRLKAIDPNSRRLILQPAQELRAELFRKQAVLESDHPEVTALRLELAAEREALRLSVVAMSEGELAGLRQQSLVFQSEEAEIGRLRSALERESFQLAELHANYELVHRDVEWYERELERTRAEQFRASGRSQVQMAAKILARGEVPVQPTSPFSPLKILVILFLMGGLGATVVVVWDHVDDTVNAEDTVAEFALPVIGRVPVSRSGPSELELVQATVAMDKPTPEGEAFRLLRTNLTYGMAGLTGKTLLITSPQPSEGKTLTSVRLAAVLSQTEGKVLLIEADLRRPRLSALLEEPWPHGLADVLAGLSSFEDAIFESAIPNLSVLPAGSTPPSPGDLFVRGRFDEVLAEAHRTYSVVVIDSPPVLGLADTSLLAPFADGVALVARRGKTRRRALRAAIEQLQGCGVTPAGLILNGLEVGDGYGYGYGYYQAKPAAAASAPGA
ncbi:MAG: polysaccharide biosynthesis tyrosine autokinase [Planctomycetes bacterium]|nr:polysaccharide biosynthesis tyrosine autokinase [Planctomycetota bacterium]